MPPVARCNVQEEMHDALRTGTSLPLKSFRVNLPPFPEQTAIASILSDMDGEIEVLAKRLEKTRAMKQGMMQELLTGKTRLV